MSEVRPNREERPQGPRERGERGERPEGWTYVRRRKVCHFCANKVAHIDYKDTGLLRRYITDRGKILSRRVTGCCATHQRAVAGAIKAARQVALVPFVSEFSS